MIAEYVARAQAWFGRAVRNSAVQHLSRTVHGERLRRGAPTVFAFLVGASIMVGQLALSTAGWPESFAAFTLASPLLSVAIMACLALAVYPPCAHQLPLYGLMGFVVLGSLQALMGAAVSIAPSPPSRVQFALMSAGVVSLGVLVLSKRVLADAVEVMLNARDEAGRRIRAARDGGDGDDAGSSSGEEED